MNEVKSPVPQFGGDEESESSNSQKSRLQKKNVNVKDDSQGEGESQDQKKKKPVQKKILYKWRAPIRHFRKMDMKKYWMVVAAVLAFYVLLALLGHYWLMVAIAAVMFVIYVLGTVPPAKTKHMITSIGVDTLEKEYRWDQLDLYWYSRKDNQYVLNIETNMDVPGRLIMLVSKEDVKRTNEILQNYLEYKTVKKQSKFSKLTEGEWVDIFGTSDGKFEGVK